MNKDFENAINNYFETVSEACEYLINHINNTSNLELKCKFELYTFLRENRVYDYIAGEREYRFHGAGCSVFVHDKKVIDWDFGYRSWWCGIDPYKMAVTLKSMGYSNELFYDSNYINALCEIMHNQDELKIYKGQYYPDLLKKETMHTCFPAVFDTMVINYFDKKLECPRTKLVDRFIRKSKIVYKYIEELENNVVLEFLDNGKVVAKILYNDAAYQDSAVEIMKALLKDNLQET